MAEISSEFDKISARTLADYDRQADAFWAGTRDHDVSQNIAALLDVIEGTPPFTLLDFVGLDTTYYITHVMYDEFKERRFASPPPLKRLVMAGWYGRKTGKGFYDYSDPANPKPNKL